MAKFKSDEIRKYYSLFRLTQSELADTLYAYFQKHYDVVHNKGNYLYVPGTSKVCLVAHIDTVHKQVPTKVYTTSSEKGTKIFSKEGIGADDRCGVISNILLHDKLINKPHLLFTYNEEIGGLGVKEFIKSDVFSQLTQKINCFIELDRNGSKDYIDYGNRSSELENIFIKEGFKKSRGSYSDVKTLSTASGIAAVNLSVGYYNQHTLNEYFIEEEMLDNVSIIYELHDKLQEKVFLIEPITVEELFDDASLEYDPYFLDKVLLHDLELYFQGYLSDDYFILEYGEDIDVLSEYGLQSSFLFEESNFFYEHDINNFKNGYLEQSYITQTYDIRIGDSFYEI